MLRTQQPKVWFTVWQDNGEGSFAKKTIESTTPRGAAKLYCQIMAQDGPVKVFVNRWEARRLKTKCFMVTAVTNFIAVNKAEITRQLRNRD